MPANFVHLHNHTDYSMLDGAARISDLMKKTAEYQMPALAITDHGNMFGAYEFYKTALKHDIKPIIGLEAYLTPGDTKRHERKRVSFGDGGGDDVSAAGAYTHMTMWARNSVGMHNLFRLSSKSWLEGFYRKPRADREILQRYHEGIIATTGCPSGEVQTYLRLGMFDSAVQAASEFQDIFGKQHFFVELMDHGIDIETKVRDDLLRLAKKINAPLVATNDLHYVNAEDADTHDNLLCVSAGSYKSATDRFKFNGSGYYLRPEEEMRTIFSNYPEACDNTVVIADQVETHFDEGMGTYMPQFPVPEGETEATWFRKQAEAGLVERYGTPLPSQVRERADTELDVIVQKGYAGYFLVVSEYVTWAKRNGIRVGPGRGSGAGSIVAYAMKITELDPLRYGLLFERFLNPERPSLPDFDIDFDERRRNEVIEHVTELYGADHVCQIVTYGTIKAKQAVRDASRILEKPYRLGDEITKSMPPAVMGKDVPLSQLFNPDHDRYAEGVDFRNLYEEDDEVREVVQVATGLEGLKRQWGVHACGMIMSSVPLEDVIPLMKRESDGQVITQFDYPSAESLGLVKMDFLGLRNLTIMDDAISNIRENRGVDVDLDALGQDPSDPRTYELISNADTLGVFQLDSDGMRSLLRLMKPDDIEDLSALSALYRPGPMGADSHTNYALRKRGRQDIVPIHPELAEPLADILGVTYGLIVYQEQVQQIAQKVAGYSLGRADLLRRAMGKKKKEVLDAEYQPFSQGMLDNGYSRDAIDTLWGILVPFSNYAFNKSHSAAYGMVTYWTAYLKANYPVEYMAALLQSVRSDKTKTAVYLNEARRMGIKVLTPDVNESQARFTAVGDDIRYGLAAIRNVGEHVVDSLIQGRTEHGPAHDFYEFLDHSPSEVCNKRVIESLIKSGAFDSMGHSRRALIDIYEDSIDEIIDIKRNEMHGQASLASFFGEDDADDSSSIFADRSVPETAEWEKSIKLTFEREMLGLYISDHPLMGLESVLESNRSISIVEAIAEENSDKRNFETVCGLITQVQRRQTKNGDSWAIVTIEDLEASIDVLVFPKVYKTTEASWVPDRLAAVSGIVENRDGSVQMSAREVSFPVSADAETEPVHLYLPYSRVTATVMEQVKRVLQRYPGSCSVIATVHDDSTHTSVRLSDSFNVRRTESLMADLKTLLGQSCMKAPAILARAKKAS